MSQSHESDTALCTVFMGPVLQYVEERGAADYALEASGLRRENLLDQTGWVDYEAYAKFLEAAAEKLDDPLLGLHAHADIGLAEHSTYGLLARHAPTVRIAYDGFFRYWHLVARGVTLETETDGERTGIAYRVPGFDRANRVQDTMGFAIDAHTALREVAGDDWEFLEIQFEFEHDARFAALEEHFGAPIRYGADATRLVFPTEILDRPSVRSDSALHAALEAHADEILRSDPSNALTDRVLRQVIELLPTGEPAVATVAERTAMGTRTLQRKLSDEGTSFAEILRDARERLARRYLKDPQLPLTEVAFLLGYSELSAFHRAFRRWTGATPREARRDAESA